MRILKPFTVRASALLQTARRERWQRRREALLITSSVASRESSCQRPPRAIRVKPQDGSRGTGGGGFVVDDDQSVRDAGSTPQC